MARQTLKQLVIRCNSRDRNCAVNTLSQPDGALLIWIQQEIEPGNHCRIQNEERQQTRDEGSQMEDMQHC